MDIFKRNIDIFDRIKQLDLPTGIYKYCHEYLKDQLDSLYYPDIYIFPLTPEGEDIYDYISTYQIENGKCIWYSIFAYGAYAHNVEYEGEIYNVVLVNND